MDAGSARAVFRSCACSGSCDGSGAHAAPLGVAQARFPRMRCSGASGRTDGRTDERRARAPRGDVDSGARRPRRSACSPSRGALAASRRARRRPSVTSSASPPPGTIGSSESSSIRPLRSRHDPMLVKRLQRMREARAATRSASLALDRPTARLSAAPTRRLDPWRRSSPAIVSTPSRTASTGSERTARRRGAAPVGSRSAGRRSSTVVLVGVGIGGVILFNDRLNFGDTGATPTPTPTAAVTAPHRSRPTSPCSC